MSALSEPEAVTVITGLQAVKNNDVEFALRKFKTQVARNGNLSKAKERAEGYKKPGVRLKEEKKKNTINSRKNNRKNY